MGTIRQRLEKLEHFKKVENSIPEPWVIEFVNPDQETDGAMVIRAQEPNLCLSNEEYIESTFYQE